MPIFKNPIAGQLARWLTAATAPRQFMVRPDGLLDDIAAAADEIERLTKAVEERPSQLNEGQDQRGSPEGQAARDAGLEEAAKVAKDRWRHWRAKLPHDLDGMDACDDIAAAILSLKSTPPKGSGNEPR